MSWFVGWLDGWWLIRDFTALASTSVETPRRMQRAVADRLLALAADVDAAPEVGAVVECEITRLRPLTSAASKRTTLRSANAVMFWIVGQLLSRPQ